MAKNTKGRLRRNAGAKCLPENVAEMVTSPRGERETFPLIKWVIPRHFPQYLCLCVHKEYNISYYKTATKQCQYFLKCESMSLVQKFTLIQRTLWSFGVALRGWFIHISLFYLWCVSLFPISRAEEVELSKQCLKGSLYSKAGPMNEKEGGSLTYTLDSNYGGRRKEETQVCFYCNREIIQRN